MHSAHLTPQPVAVCKPCKPCKSSRLSLNEVNLYEQYADHGRYMVCLFQNWEGDEIGKTRIRRFRYSTMVAVARDVGIRHARHPSYRWLEYHAFSWHDFVLREQLIRTMMWVFLLDTAFVIFNNVPPRLAIKEMRMHLACNEASFQAPTAESCLYHLRSTSGDGPYLLSSLTANMCRATMTAAEQASVADVGPLNLFALTSCKQCDMTV